MDLKPIETVYNGYKFRSRLEARWAVFFDKMGLNYRYEAEGYNLDKVGYYLPDFFLPTYNLFVEVKPQYKISDREKLKASELSNQSGFPVLMVFNCSDKQTHLLFYKGNIWHVSFIACNNCNSIGLLNVETGKCFYENNTCLGGCKKENILPLFKFDYFNSRQHFKLLAATLAAQQARFEFGQTPQPGR